MRNDLSWLSKLKIVELQRLAILLGAPVSGTRATRIRGIRNVLPARPPHQGSLGQDDSLNIQHGQTTDPPDKLSVVSIDMGIRNLAFTHFTTSLGSCGSSSARQYGLPTLQSWRKIDVGSSARASLRNDGRASVASKRCKKSNSEPDLLGDEDDTVVSPTESFEPAVYAEHAYNIITSIVDEQRPTHILIERQRFRSGGSSAVLEWTIRVGVFEGMLYAVLRTLRGEAAETKAQPLVESILPAMVNRYWLDGPDAGKGLDAMVEKRQKISGREVKKVKINLVGRLLEGALHTIDGRQLEIPSSQLKLGGDVLELAKYFDEDVKRAPNARRKKLGDTSTESSGNSISKLDDLADCLLQGLAWLHWQNNRLKAVDEGQDAFNLSVDTLAVKQTKKRS